VSVREDGIVDSVNGAKELARRLAERHGELPPLGPQGPIADTDAAPIYHWLGIEPPRRGGEDETDGAGRSDTVR
jgi:hypothetical protein